MKETPAEVAIHCFLLMFITMPKSGKNSLLAFKNNFLPNLYCLEESVLLKDSCFGDSENYLCLGEISSLAPLRTKRVTFKDQVI